MHCPACGHQNKPGSDTCVNCMLSLAHLGEADQHDRVERSLTTETVAALNPRQPVTVPENADLGSAIRLMIDCGVGAVLVVAPTGSLIGILTERDFLTKIAGQPDYTALPVLSFMTRQPETVGAGDTLAYALGKMDAGGYRHLPVVSGEQPTGVISVRDILRHVTRLCQEE
jgi:CBS domain-containing protein